jgi:AcrR family transcriptional regulator
MTDTSNYSIPVRGPADHDVRDQIVAAATEHFSRYGYAKTTVSDLARMIGFSKAYIYKFFESKQVIGELICANCLGQIEAEVDAALGATDLPAEKLRYMFQTSMDASLRLLRDDSRLYEIAVSAATEHWPAVATYEARTQQRLRDILQQGRKRGDFERKTPLEEAVIAIYLVMRPYLNPALLQHSIGRTDGVPKHLSSLVLRSLSP